MPHPFRLAVTADLHHDVPRSRPSAESLASNLLAADVDGLLLVGDTATSDGDALEQALSLFGDAGDGRPRLFVPGNHELWSRQRRVRADDLLKDELPRRVRAMGWHWLPTDPFTLPNGWAIIGNGGWYDFQFAAKGLELPRRFYEAGLSPRVAGRYAEGLDSDADDVPAAMREFVARWNDVRFVHGIESAERFARQRLAEFERDLDAVKSQRVLAAVHVVPHVALLPQVPDGPIPPDRLKYAFARAYLGSPTFGEAVATRRHVRHLVCGHSHTPRRATAEAGQQLHNVGSNYEQKRMLIFDLD